MAVPNKRELGDGVHLQVLGPLRVWRAGVELDAGPRQQRCLLALLMAREGRPISTADLIALIWGPDAPASAVNVIHKYVGALRRLLEPGLPARVSGAHIVRHGPGYRFTAGSAELDLVTFRRLVAAAQTSVRRDLPGEALDRYVRALRRCQGNAGEALADGTAATAVFTGVDGEFFDAVVGAAALAVRLRRPAEVLAPLRLAARMSRLNEPVHAWLITTLAALGHQAEALMVYQAIRDRLVEELGIDPGTDLREAHRRVLTRVVPAAVAPARPARPVPYVRPAQLPPDLPLFAGRADETAALTALAGAHGRAAGRRAGPLVIALHGMPGVGKSTLAVHFAHRVAARFPDGQLYLDLRGDQDEESRPVGEALRPLLYALGMPAANVPDTPDAGSGMYRSLTAGKRFLILLDNVRDVAQVRRLLPGSAESLVLVTSRGPLTDLATFDGARLMRVDVPGRAAARELLGRRLAAAAAGVAVDPAVADEIVERCGRLPLALAVLAARLCARPALSVSTVLAELRDDAGPLRAFEGGRGVHDPRTAFSWSYRRLSPDAARLFRLLAAGAGRGPRRGGADLAELVASSLVAEDAAGHISMHVLVRAYAKELVKGVDLVMSRGVAEPAFGHPALVLAEQPDGGRRLVDPLLV
ncbi:BTAD domain-containing putative transcriptional regulator [Actinoplanes sp. NBRC 101535]|uniref:AfsR/SARP family transcriptional regulator n=1 Tax=Actinoplanes sp. NBRC 101535 TaxID=3032196 RepID=UPI0024A45FDE|nr:BTAD domain-containing putative transcriptional regulator [Actinoplanes sp. NBRC 101535]GLY02412.1 hypothetical protein Acsp01_27910 [Actinoplanes sp. NBRC 101535]